MLRLLQNPQSQWLQRTAPPLQSRAARLRRTNRAADGFHLLCRGETSGEGDPLIVLHGAYMNIRTMGEIISVLARSRQVIAVEMQAHGRTTDIDRPIIYPKLADDVAAFVDAIGVEKADVFGYSMGAAVDLQMAIRHPEKVDRAALASIAYDFKGLASRLPGLRAADRP